MDKATFVKIFNQLMAIGRTIISKKGTSICCFAFLPDTSGIESLLPDGWAIKTTHRSEQTGEPFTVIFRQSQMTADEAFAAFESA